MDIKRQALDFTRPSVLIRAAQIHRDTTTQDYRLRRVFGQLVPQCSQNLYQGLLERENLCDTQRKQKDPAYNMHHHILLLSAILYEIKEYNNFLVSDANLCTK